MVGPLLVGSLIERNVIIIESHNVHRTNLVVADKLTLGATMVVYRMSIDFGATNRLPSKVIFTTCE